MLLRCIEPFRRRATRARLGEGRVSTPSRPFTTVLVKDSFGSRTARFFREHAQGPKVRGRSRQRTRPGRVWPKSQLGGTQRFDRVLANDRKRRYLAVRTCSREGPQTTLFGASARLCRTHRVAGGTLPAVDLAMPHNPVLGYASAPLRYRIIQITLIV